MVYLIAADHNNSQRKYRGHDLTESHREFRSAVDLAIRSHRLGVLAEEDHPEFLAEHKAESVLLEIAREHGITHQFVDPNTAEREKIGYRSHDFIMKAHGLGDRAARAHEIAHQFRKREEFWLSKLQPSLDENILFVCGWGHVESFRSLLTNNGVRFSILADQLGVDTKGRAYDKNVREYITQHAREFNRPECFCHSRRSVPLG